MDFFYRVITLPVDWREVDTLGSLVLSWAVLDLDLVPALTLDEVESYSLDYLEELGIN